MPFPGFWPRSLRNQEDVPWLLGKGAGKGQLGHPGNLDSGVLEAGLLVGAITGPRPGLPGARGESLICLDFLKLQCFSGWGHVCYITSPALVVLDAVPLPWRPWIDPHSVLGPWPLLGCSWSLSLTHRSSSCDWAQ